MSFDTRDGDSVRDLAEAQSNGNVIGLAAVTGYIVPRRDIDDYLLNDPESFNLFLLALRALQHPGRSDDPMSYYQIAGIHGMPRVPWNGIQVAQKASSATVAGYCAHASDTFPTWHRPYLALMEQTIYSTMVELVHDFPHAERAAQLEAANRFRLPYWDYWKPRGGAVKFPGIAEGRWTGYDYDFRMPDILVAKYVMVRKPAKDVLVPIENPLAAFRIPKVGPDTAWLDAWGTKTRRYPEARKPVQAMNDRLNMARESNTTHYMDMLRGPAYRSYADFGTNAFGQFYGGTGNSPRPTGSLEGIHNTYHGLIGGTRGHMGDPQVAAFDPVFWIHHCQIDRLLAIWQATHPNSWFDGYDDKVKDSSLLPFSYFQGRQATQWWTSDTVRNTKTFGYSYTDVVAEKTPGDVKNRYIDNYYWTTQARREATPKNMRPTNVFAKARVFRYDDETWDILISESEKTGALEGVLPKRSSKHLARPSLTRSISSRSGSGRSTSNRSMTDLSSSMQRASISRSSSSEGPITEGRVLSSVTDSDLVISHHRRHHHHRHEIDESEVKRVWYVDSKVERLTLNGTFTIFFFVGKPDDEDPASYHNQPTLAGTTHNFVAPVERCDNCGRQDEQGHHVSGTVVITPILKDYCLINELADLSPRRVKHFLIRHLKWRIVMADGRSVDPRYVRGLSFGISSKITYRETGEVRYQDHNEIIEEILYNSAQS